MSDELKFNQEYISYKPKEQKVFPIQEHDWNKLKSMAESCVSSSGTSLKDVGLVLIGGGISAVLSLIALYNSTEVATWILNSNWIILICAIVIGIVLLILDKRTSKKQSQNIEQIIEEMMHIEGKYYFPKSKNDSKEKHSFMITY